MASSGEDIARELPERPVWLLDVDGVVNANRPGWARPPRRDSVWSDTDGVSYSVRWAPALLDRIRLLHRRGAVEVRWCTTWCPDAHRLEHLWRLPLLVRAVNADPMPRGAECWPLKLAAARAVLAEGRRLVWTDDEALPPPGPVRSELTSGGRALLIAPASNRGLQPDDLVVRPASLADLPALVELRLANAEAHIALDPGVYRVPPREAVIHHFTTRLADEAGRDAVLVAERDGQVVGMIEVLVLPDPPAHQILRPEPSAQVHTVVLGEARGQGVGSALLEAAERWASQRGITNLSAGIHHGNAGAVRFYRRHGYAAAGISLCRRVSG